MKSRTYMAEPLFALALSMVCTAQAQAQTSSGDSSEEITVEYEKQPKEEEEFSFQSGIERIFKNPILASGLDSGSEAINRSIESIIESVFYSLLDRSYNIELTHNTRMSTGLHRDVLSTNAGHYVVVDRFRLGPNYDQRLANIEGLSLDTNVSAHANIYHIYLRSDAIRLAEQGDLPWYRGLLNNWLGALPILSMVLPPSFNPNELYDPLKQLTTPFIFPTTADLFYRMREGSILSYAMNQGVRLPLDIAAAFGEEISQLVGRIENFKFSFPLSIFVAGEYRINVLRREKHLAWVGLSRSRRAGTALTTEVGKVANLLEHTFQFWEGLKIPVFPISLEASRINYDRDDLLYEFDLRHAKATEAYEKAVRGDFTLAHDLHDQHKSAKQSTGVRFHFNRLAKGKENQSNNTQNIILSRQSAINNRSLAEIEILDDRGRFFVLEAQQNHEDEYWDALLGVEKQAIQNQAELRVIKIQGQDDNSPNNHIYSFAASEADPMNLTLSLKLQDRYTDSEEYNTYIDEIRKFTHLPLQQIPKLPVKSTRRTERRDNRIRLSNPNNHHLIPHVPALFLGRFSATSAIHINNEQLQHIISHSEDEVWIALADAFDQDRRLWGDALKRQQVAFTTRWLNRLILFPLRLLGWKHAGTDFYHDAERTVRAIKNIRNNDAPMKKVDAFYELFNTEYPRYTAHALLNLADLQKVPRSVSFHTQARGSAEKNIRDQFQNLSGRVFKSNLSFSPPERQRIAKEKLLAFVPSSLREAGSRPELVSMKIRAKDLPESVLSELRSATIDLDSTRKQKIITRHVYANFKATQVKARKPLKVYIRFEQGGKLQLGRFRLAEQVVNVDPAESIFDLAATADLTTQSYELWLTGPLSPLRGILFEQAIAFGGDFDVSLAISQDGVGWSDEKVIRFHFDNGNLSRQ